LGIFGLYFVITKRTLTNPKRSKDFKLVVNAQKNSNYFGLLYNKYYRSIFAYIFKKIKDKENTADITSKVFLKALLNINKYEDRGFLFSSWLYKIASNEVNKYYRENSKIQQVDLQEKDAIVFLNEIDSDNKEQNIKDLLNSLQKLPREQSDLIEMRFFEKLSFNEIGELLGITGNNAKIKTYRAIDKLKTIFFKK